MNEILNKINKKILVSCQANEEINPFNAPESMLKMATAAKIGGCAGFRANGLENVKIIKEAFPEMPMIGIWKVVSEGNDVYITPTMREVEALMELGSDIIAVDGTDRVNAYGKKAYELIKEIKEKYPDQLVMADIATLNEARLCVDAGADIISTTLSGYTEETKYKYGPFADFDLIKDIRKEFSGAFINAEGRIWSREDAKKAFECGANTVVVGTAITNPMLTTKRFVDYLK